MWNMIGLICASVVVVGIFIGGPALIIYCLCKHYQDYAEWERRQANG